MKVLVVNGSEVRTLLPMDECIDVMSDALAALARSEAMVPLRQIMWLPEKVGALGMMPGYISGIDAVGLKVITVFPGNHGTRYDSHQGAVLLFEATHGQLLAIMDATTITAIRTAAVSGVATRLLAREDAESLAILGSGVQAGTHLAAMLHSRPIQKVRVWSRDAAHAQRFAERESKRHGIAINVMTTVQDAVKECDIICTTTSAREPILKGEWITPGTHINAVGSSVPFTRELDSTAVKIARLFVDRRESALNEAGDFLLARKEGIIEDTHIVGEIGEIMIGEIDGRRTSDEITLFKSVGAALEDLAAGVAIYKAVAGTGT